VIESGRHFSLSSYLGRWAERTPDAAALAAPGHPPLTFGRLASQVESGADALSDLGVSRGDRVAIILPQGPAVITAFLAVAARAVSVPLNPTLNECDYASQFLRLQPAAVILQRGFESPATAAARRLTLPIIELSVVPGGGAGEFTLDGDRLLRPVSGGFSGPDDVAMMLSTSGTTSWPKLIPLTHRNLCAAAENTGAALELTPRDRCLNVMPLFHGHGLVAGALAPMMAGGSLVCTFGFDAAMFFRWLDEYRPTWYTAVPTIHRAILAEAPRHPRVIARSPLRFIRSASAHLPLAVMTDLEHVFGTLVTEGYGLSEALQLTNTPLDLQTRKLGSLGTPGTSEVATMDELHNLLGSNEVGEIVCRGPVLMTGYYDDVEANEGSFTNGWFRTGDLGSLDAEGHLYLTGRLKDIINRAGEKVSPQEVDDVLRKCPHVIEAVTFAVPHATLGEDVAAAVVVQSGGCLGESDIRAFAARHLPAFKIPHRIRIVEEIPKGPTGKVQRSGLAEKFGLASPTGGASRRAKVVAPRSPLEHQVAAIWEELFDVSSIGADDDFFDLGGDSLMAAALMAAIEETCGRVLSPAVLLEASTVARLAAAVFREEDSFDEPLTALRDSGTRTPLFFVHNDDGRGLYTYNLARSLDTDRPVYAVHLHGLAKHSLPGTVEAIATDRLLAVRAGRPHGPYVLGGHCNGGVVALEMAHQLRAAGECVEVVVLIDTSAPSLGRCALHRAVDVLARLRRLPPAGRAELHLRITRTCEEVASWARYYHNRFCTLVRSGAPAQMGFMWRKLAGAVRHVTERFETRTASGSEAQNHPASASFAEPGRAYRRAVRRYVPPPYEGRVVLVLAEELPVTRPNLGWSRRLLPRLEVVVTPGDHHTCITRYVTAFAARLENIILRVEPGA
jgi:acyl-CoA synthetase (AMP-forming)/AMP-acid ligase II/thioesterase domain-containing protein/acyl carrier protein